MANVGCNLASETNKTEQEIIKLTLWADSAGILQHVCIYFLVQMGDTWWDTNHPCISFSCSGEGIQTVSKVCPVENCQEVQEILLLHPPQLYNTLCVRSY